MTYTCSYRSLYTAPVEKPHEKSSYFNEIMAFKRDFVDVMSPIPTSSKKWHQCMHEKLPGAVRHACPAQIPRGSLLPGAARHACPAQIPRGSLLPGAVRHACPAQIPPCTHCDASQLAMIATESKAAWQVDACSRLLAALPISLPLVYYFFPVPSQTL